MWKEQLLEPHSYWLIPGRQLTFPHFPGQESCFRVLLAIWEKGIASATKNQVKTVHSPHLYEPKLPCLEWIGTPRKCHICLLQKSMCSCGCLTCTVESAMLVRISYSHCLQNKTVLEEIKPMPVYHFMLLRQHFHPYLLLTVILLHK